MREHEHATFNCEVYPSKAPLNWLINGRKLKDDKKYKITSNGNRRQLTVKDTREEDTCTITGSLGEAVSEANLTVEGDIYNIFD